MTRKKKHDEQNKTPPWPPVLPAKDGYSIKIQIGNDDGCKLESDRSE